MMMEGGLMQLIGKYVHSVVMCNSTVLIFKGTVSQELRVTLVQFRSVQRTVESQSSSFLVVVNKVQYTLSQRKSIFRDIT